MVNITEQHEKEMIERAQRGDAEAGRDALYSIALAIDAMQFDSLLLPYLSKCLLQFNEGVPLERALNVEEIKTGGRPFKYDDTQLAAIDILLRDYADYAPEESITWIVENIGADRRKIQRLRIEHDSRYNEFDAPLMESLSKDLLLHLSGSMRENIAEVIPH